MPWADRPSLPWRLALCRLKLFPAGSHDVANSYWEPTGGVSVPTVPCIPEGARTDA